MPEALYFTEDEEANRLLADDPFALLVGFALDQQVTVQQAFLGPLRLKERLGTLEPADGREGRPRAAVPGEAGDPPLSRLDGDARAASSPRPSRRSYDGDASRVWTEADGRRRPPQRASARCPASAR